MSAAVNQRYQDKGYRNWLSCINALRALRCLLRTFIEEQTQKFHSELVDKLDTDTCTNKCDIERNSKPNELPIVCVVCTTWSYELLENHSAKGSPIHWSNCNPQRWPLDKWEVAKVYMPGGHKTHVKFDDFDIASLINLMSRCTHFHRVIKAKKLQQTLNSVTEVRNQVMHAPDFTISSEDLKKHLRKVRDLGRALKPFAPELQRLSEEIDKGTGEQSLEDFQQMELLLMEEKIIYISVSFSAVPDTQNETQDFMGLVGSLWSFMSQHQDLQEALSTQMAHLYWLMDHKEQIRQDVAKLQQQQEIIHHYQQVIENQQKEEIEKLNMRVQDEYEKYQRLIEDQEANLKKLLSQAEDDMKKMLSQLKIMEEINCQKDDEIKRLKAFQCSCQ